MARWLVKLEGERADLEELPVRFPEGELYAVEENSEVYLTGQEFDSLPGAEQVRARAMLALEEMSAVISLLWVAFRKPVVDHLAYENDQGGRSARVFVKGVENRAKASLCMTVIRQDGTREDVAGADARPTEAQRLLAAPRASSHPAWPR